MKHWLSLFPQGKTKNSLFGAISSYNPFLTFFPFLPMLTTMLNSAFMWTEARAGKSHYDVSNHCEHLNLFSVNSVELRERRHKYGS